MCSKTCRLQLAHGVLTGRGHQHLVDVLQAAERERRRQIEECQPGPDAQALRRIEDRRESGIDLPGERQHGRVHRRSRVDRDRIRSDLGDDAVDPGFDDPGRRELEREDRQEEQQRARHLTPERAHVGPEPEQQARIVGTTEGLFLESVGSRRVCAHAPSPAALARSASAEGPACSRRSSASCSSARRA